MPAPRMLRAEARISITPYTAGGSQDAPHSVCHRQEPGCPSLRMPRAKPRIPVTPYARAEPRIPVTPYATGRTQDTRHSVCHRRKLGRPAHPYAVGGSQGIQCHGRRGRKYRKTPVCPAPARTRPGIWLPAPSAAQCPGRLSPGHTRLSWRPHRKTIPRRRGPCKAPARVRPTHRPWAAPAPCIAQMPHGRRASRPCNVPSLALVL